MPYGTTVAKLDNITLTLETGCRKNSSGGCSIRKDYMYRALDELQSWASILLPSAYFLAISDPQINFSKICIAAFGYKLKARRPLWGTEDLEERQDMVESYHMNVI